MARARRSLNPASLSFLDAMTCGLGAVILLYMVINASVRLRSDELTEDLQGEVDRVQREVLDGHRRLVELRNTVREVEDENALAQGLSRRMIEAVQAIRVELATFDETTIARREHIERLKADLKSLEEGAKRLSAAAPSEETPGDRIRTHIGDGDRQYLTGLKVGGKRVFLLVDASASMLDETIVNIIRWRNLPDEQKINADKWQQAVASVDWLTTQMPRDSRFQLYTFNERARSVVAGTDGQWLDGSDRKALDQAVAALRTVVPEKGTNLFRAFEAIDAMHPRPDNVFLLVDGLPTQGRATPRSRTVSPRQRERLFRRAVDQLPSGIPVNVLLFPMEGDPIAASAYWKLAMVTRGSFMCLSEDWP
jgi:hypothetical protein